MVEDSSKKELEEEKRFSKMIKEGIDVTISSKDSNTDYLIPNWAYDIKGVNCIKYCQFIEDCLTKGKKCKNNYKYCDLILSQLIGELIENGQ